MLPNVAILHWPEQAAVVAYLRAQGHPRLLLVAPDVDVPATVGWDEDWVRLPAREDDVRVRASLLAARITRPTPLRPELRPDGRVFFNDRWTAVSPAELQMLRLLVDRFEEVVDSKALAEADADDERALSPTAVRVHLTRLRRRLGPIGLVVRTVRGRGYVLEAGATNDGVVEGASPEEPARSRSSSGFRRSTDPPSGADDGQQLVVRVGELVIDQPRHHVTVSGETVDLTPTEFAFLSLLARHPGEVVPHQTILDGVWGPEVENTHYLRIYARKLRKKLDRLPGAPGVRTVPAVGYQLIDPGAAPNGGPAGTAT
ncbi:MAG TPA: winged helix-turn-helix domain-containing protein [Acidimicrobiales bacterium]